MHPSQPVCSQEAFFHTIKERALKRVVLFAVFFAVVQPLWAKTFYVSDDLSIHMRRAPGVHASVIEPLDSGTPVSVLKKSDGYAEVESPDGKRGWIRAGYLQDKPVASDRLGKAQKKLASVTQEHHALKEKLKAAVSTKSQQATAIDNLKKRNQALKQRLTQVTNASAHSLQISRQNNRLKARIARLEQKRSKLRSRVRVIESRREGILMGAAIVIAGILAGLILPFLRFRRKRSSWQSF